MTSLPFRETPTFQRLYGAEFTRSGSQQRAFSRALVLRGFLLSLADYDKVGALPFAHSTYVRHKAALRRLGFAPLATPLDLAQLGHDLGISDPDRLTRLLWTLQTDEQRSFEKVASTWADFVAEAQALIPALEERHETAVNEPVA
jgi:hypothetical protein